MQTGNAQALTELDISDRALRATFATDTALERATAACESHALRDSLQRAGVRCTREGARLVMELTRGPAAARS